MKAYRTFLGKELTESLRTYKVLLLVVIFLLLGVMNPLTAKISPDLMAAVMPDMNIQLPDPVSLDSWTQFFKNVGQIGMIVVIIIFGGVLSHELDGPLIPLLTKGLSRTSVLLAKFTNMAGLFTGAYLLAAGVTYVYTRALFTGNDEKHLFFAIFCLWLFGVLLLSLLLLGGVIKSNHYGSLLFTGLIFLLLTLLQLIPSRTIYNPVALATKNVALLDGSLAITRLYPALGITAAAIVVCVGLGILLFRKK